METNTFKEIAIYYASGAVSIIWMSGPNFDYLTNYILLFNMNEFNEPFCVVQHYRTFEDIKEEKILEMYVNVMNIEKIVAEYQDAKE